MKIRQPDTCGECTYRSTADGKCLCVRVQAPFLDVRHKEEDACRAGKLNRQLWELELNKARSIREHAPAPVELQEVGVREVVDRTHPLVIIFGGAAGIAVYELVRLLLTL